MNNQQRIGTARFAIASACFARGQAPDYGEDSLTDLLADLRHYCAAHGLDYERCERIAAMYFSDESAGSAA
jgi:hypothetical protein